MRNADGAIRHAAHAHVGAVFSLPQNAGCESRRDEPFDRLGASDEQLAPALELQRRAQWRLDFVAAENSMGFHAPQEAARVLGEAADYARQGQVAAMSWREGGAAQVAQQAEE